MLPLTIMSPFKGPYKVILTVSFDRFGGDNLLINGTKRSIDEPEESDEVIEFIYFNHNNVEAQQIKLTTFFKNFDVKLTIRFCFNV